LDVLTVGEPVVNCCDIFLPFGIEKADKSKIISPELNGLQHVRSFRAILATIIVGFHG
jgi:hypothetical protein